METLIQVLYLVLFYNVIKYIWRGKMKILDVPHTNITEMKQSPGSVFDKVKESNPDVYVFKNNKPYGVVMTTDQYEAMYNKIEMLQDRLEEYVIRERNDVGPAAFPRHGTKPMSGQRCFPDMARNRCRARGVSPTWHETDVGTAAKTANKHKTTGNSNDFRWFLINLIYALL